jgi:hypothetical protein
MQIILTKEEYDKLVADARSVQDQVTEQVREAKRKMVVEASKFIRNISTTEAFRKQCNLLHGSRGGFGELMTWVLSHVADAADKGWQVDYERLEYDPSRGPDYRYMADRV